MSLLFCWLTFKAMSPSILSVDIEGDVTLPSCWLTLKAMSPSIFSVDIEGDVTLPSCWLTFKAMSPSILSVDIEVILFLVSTKNAKSQGVESVRVLDHVIRDYAFRSYVKHPKTGLLYNVSLPESLSGVGADTVRFRCGSLRRYGAQVKEFLLPIGVTVRPCVERVVIVLQNLGYNWSSIYYDNYNVSGYQLVSPVLGLLAYHAGDLNSTTPFDLGIFAGKKPITIDFSNFTKMASSDLRPLCASFDLDGNVTIIEQVSLNICIVSGHGHFGLLVEPSLPKMRTKVNRWKIVIGSSIGGVLGAFLLGLLLIALLVKVKKRSRMAEMERRAYEEEALQMSMVGHVRAPTATGTRTLPTIEHEYSPPS
ncbi:hypothetical protein HHK36_027859 [Tetracentron sinense]|uniref:Uncharacterized protein n=1 Tax=Tetracentron sinense TaxID=13715 RepID=A0A834YFJ9_TETSI|nr:hypothetical protein HHK36_027859 [Tetracentron sinense]